MTHRLPLRVQIIYMNENSTIDLVEKLNEWSLGTFNELKELEQSFVAKRKLERNSFFFK